MELKEELLRKVLASEGIENVQINRVVVFTDNRIEVQNKYTKIRTCFVSQLAYIIDSFKSQTNLSQEDMEKHRIPHQTGRTQRSISFHI